jgi:protein-S-isoprenylcysteine O-methyltransferase Ste14
MKTVLNQIFSFILPIFVLILVPLLIEHNRTVHDWASFSIGLLLIFIGLYLLSGTNSLLIRKGKGTLAPWSPTKKLVITGPYRYVRNPMIIGVWIALIGEAVALLSVNIGIWAILFFILNTVYFILYEEPNLEKKFGEPYQTYKKKVHRWIPKLKAYKDHHRSLV